MKTATKPYISEKRKKRAFQIYSLFYNISQFTTVMIEFVRRKKIKKKNFFGKFPIHGKKTSFSKHLSPHMSVNEIKRIYFAFQ